ncbi:sensor histidine kinase [Jiulongibacter sediminis]|uniref:histidine kinase n=1 Tax=Jiulongibacter sediminis TaxID=1605367 RepID=A0A0P7BQ41_9BACT|nr:HAMP domain-containing sensor histidine kinase [Jiulongibacter sediminis]KPM47320.1 histidine kinase [Jiulongibacter sediminis]TBX22877.1 histidine kinase [Jiulongibacter sediminis]
MKRFSLNIAFRIILLAAFICPVPFLWLNEQRAAAIVLFVFALITGVSFYQYATSVNKKLTLFFESIRYSDFTVKFSSDNKQGKSFSDLNQQMNEVVDAFKAARAEKEANIQFLNTLVQHVDVGIICYDAGENIEILNNAAIRLLEVYRLRELKDLLPTAHVKLYTILRELNSGERVMYETENGSQLAINATKVNLRGRAVKIISLQNIRTELQQKEVSSWQNLTKVLRHEIMNSIAPIVSMVGTMRSIVNEDLSDKPEIEDSVEDLGEALKTIENRGKGIMKFVNAYRDFTTLPKPLFRETTVAAVLERVETLIKADAQTKNVKLSIEIEHPYRLNIDLDQIEMVLINLVKNATEAIENKAEGKIEIRAYQQKGQRFILVKDNGNGIVPEALEKIFIPFYTTKKTGSGIGLSLSKQILQLHHGDLTVKSELGKGSAFRLEF